ncbi:hypothetical protein DFH27DRAFT_294627 [Peziza echinospora]|nr:hypothetical protein DFH27DRAFT_294627 [Peziza echinospora]
MFIFHFLGEDGGGFDFFPFLSFSFFFLLFEYLWIPDYLLTLMVLLYSHMLIMLFLFFSVGLSFSFFRSLSYVHILQLQLVSTTLKSPSPPLTFGSIFIPGTGVFLCYLFVFFVLFFSFFLFWFKLSGRGWKG